jgi:hypothetical protein
VLHFLALLTFIVIDDKIIDTCRIRAFRFSIFLISPSFAFRFALVGFLSSPPTVTTSSFRYELAKRAFVAPADGFMGGR